MAKKSTNDSFAAIRKAGTGGPNYDLDTDAIIERLRRWQSLCSFTVTGAGGDTVDIEFKTLPKDMETFVRDLCEFCPDLVDQGTGCVHEMIEMMEETGEELTPEMKKLTQGVDFTDENYGLEILTKNAGMPHCFCKTSLKMM